jgi:hypothetical protein
VLLEIDHEYLAVTAATVIIGDVVAVVQVAQPAKFLLRALGQGSLAVYDLGVQHLLQTSHYLVVLHLRLLFSLPVMRKRNRIQQRFPRTVVAQQWLLILIVPWKQHLSPVQRLLHVLGLVHGLSVVLL